METGDLFRGLGVVATKELPDKVVKSRGPLDEEIVLDADSRHEQFTEEAGRWQDDRADDRK